MSDAKRLRALEDEDRRLKHWVANLSLDNQALKAADGNKARAARLLGVSRPRLYKMMERHGVRG